jgi:hypothetical protein
VGANAEFIINSNFGSQKEWVVDVVGTYSYEEGTNTILSKIGNSDTPIIHMEGDGLKLRNNTNKLITIKSLIIKYIKY